VQPGYVWGVTESAPHAAQPLAGVRIVEISSFVAVPLAGMTLAQLGAEVIRVDPIGGAADYHRWPVTHDGVSIYWAGLNKGKRSVAANMRTPGGRRLVQRLIVDSGVLVTNVAGRQWHSYDTLVKQRPDIIHVEVSGRADGSTAVDYTVNAAVGFPMVTGPGELATPVNHVLPAWDVACGVYAALGVTAALRHRDATGQGGRISIPLENVALATAGSLGFLTEAMVNKSRRERIGNSVYGQYGQDFTSRDGASFMIVALTGRHFRDLTELTGTAKAVAALAEVLDVDFTDEGDRYRHRDALTGLFSVWFAEHTADEITAALSATSILWDRYRSFLDVINDDRVTANPMFTPLQQPGIGEYLAAGLPMSIGGAYSPAAAAPAVGDDTAAVLRHRLGMNPDDIEKLIESGTVATTSADEPAG
jgi:2-methylfumaryl-CoA isomerase